MDTAELLKVRNEGPVTEIVGRIQDVDMPADKKSPKTGKNELCQDIVIELPDRTKVAIAFWDLSARCFSRDGKMDDLLVFPREAAGYWIRVRDTNPREKHSLSRRTGGRAPRHYAEKRGVPVYLKATPTVSVEWVLERGQQPPRMGPPRRVKKPKPLQVPGQTSGGGSKTMSDQGVPGRRGGTNTGGSVDRRPPPRDERRPPTTTPPAGQQEQRREQTTEGSKPAGKKPTTPREWLDLACVRNAAAHHKITGVLREHYIKQDVHVSDSFLAEASKTIHTQLVHFKGPLATANLSLLSATGEQISYAIDELCYCYFLCHMSYLQQAEARKEIVPTDDVAVRTHVTTVFLGTVNTYPINLPR